MKRLRLGLVMISVACSPLFFGTVTEHSLLAAEESLTDEHAQGYSKFHSELKTRLGIKGGGNVRVSSHSGRFGRDLVMLQGEVILAHVEKRTGQVTGFLNKDVSRSRRQWLEEVGDDAPSKPVRDKREIRALARGYLKKLIGTPRPPGYVPEVTYSERGASKGEWRLIYWRTRNGRKYQLDFISVSIVDISGELSGFGRAPRSDACPTAVKLSAKEAKSRATEVAIAYVPKLFGKHEVGDVQAVSLESWIVNPNYLLTAKMDEPGYTRSWTPKARLAHVVTVSFVGRCHVIVWIDAATGEVLGGGWG